MKTIKEAAKRYSHNLIPDESGMSFPLEREAIQDAIKFGVQFAETWIPVDEELPEESEEDLIIKIEDEGDTFHVIAIYWMGQFTDLEYIYHPTHWRPISRK